MTAAVVSAVLVHGAAWAATPLLGLGGQMDTLRHGPLSAFHTAAVTAPDRRLVLASYEFNGADNTRGGFVLNVGLGMAARPELASGGPVGALALGAQIKTFDFDIAPGVYLASSVVLRGGFDVGFTLFGEGDTDLRTAAEGLLNLELGAFQSYSARLTLGWSQPIVFGGGPVLRTGFTAHLPLDEPGSTPDDFSKTLSATAGDGTAGLEPPPTGWAARKNTSVLVVGIGLDRELLESSAADTIRFTVGILYP